MDMEPEEFQYLSLLGIYRASLSLLLSHHRPLFIRISATLLLPLSLLFLAHVHISSILFSSISTIDSALESAAPGSATENRLLHRLVDDWLAFLLFKAVYLLALLVLSLLSTSAIVYTIASIFSAKQNLSFSVVLSVVPKVWRRLMTTFVSAFLLLVAFHSVALLLLIFDMLVLDATPLEPPFTILLILAYLSGLVYISVIWHLASVISVLEDSKGFAAMQKSRQLIKGKFWIAAAIFIKLNFCFILVEIGYKSLVVRSESGFMARLWYGTLMLALLCIVVLFALVVQTVVYFVCKAYHHENIDKSNLSDHLEVYLGEYVPLTAKDVQMEQFHV